MTRKKVTSKESKESGEISSPRQSKFKLIKKQKEKSSIIDIDQKIASNENETKESSPFTPSLPKELNSRIRSRAYELYKRRGGHPGQDLVDWLEAERQILSEGA